MRYTSDFRTIYVEGKWLKCPRYIYRRNKSAFKNGHWVVCFNRKKEPYYSKCFSDTKYGDDHMKSFEASKKHLLEMQKHYTENDKLHIPYSQSVTFNFTANKHINSIYGQFFLFTVNGVKRYLRIHIGRCDTKETLEKMDSLIEHSDKVLKWRQKVIRLFGRNNLENIEIPDYIKNPFRKSYNGLNR